MFATIYVADDGPGRGRDALRLARHLSGPETRFVVGSVDSTSDVVEIARREGVDLIVMGLSRHAAQLLHGSAIPVALAPAGYADGPDDRLRVIGVGFDGAPESRAALRAAEQLALEHGATMRVFAVIAPNTWTTSRIEPTPEEYRAVLRETLGEQLREEVETLDSGVRAAALVMKGEPVGALAEKSGEGLDLLVVGSRGYGPVRRVVFGSVVRGLLEAVDCPLLVLPRTSSTGGEVDLAVSDHAVKP